MLLKLLFDKIFRIFNFLRIRRITQMNNKNILVARANYWKNAYRNRVNMNNLSVNEINEIRTFFF